MQNRVVGWAMLTMVSSSNKPLGQQTASRVTCFSRAFCPGCWQAVCSVVFLYRCCISNRALKPKREKGRDGMNTLSKSAEKISPFFMALLLLRLKETTFRVPEVEFLRWNVVRPTGPVGHPGYTFFEALISFSPTTSYD